MNNLWALFMLTVHFSLFHNCALPYFALSLFAPSPSSSLLLPSENKMRGKNDKRGDRGGGKGGVVGGRGQGERK